MLSAPTHHPHPPAGAAPLGLDWLDRSVCLYLIAPLFLFCAWFITPVTLALLALALCGTFFALRGPAPKLRLAWYWLLGVAALALLETTLSGIGHFFYTNFFDWVIRDAVLRDLSVAPWPPTYFDHSVHTEELIFILRAAVSYYLPAALVGNWFGNNAANYALFVWTVLGMTLTLLSACRIFPTRTQKVLCLLVFSFFGGLDWVGFSWRYGIPPLGQVLGWWSSYVQYSPNSTLLCWVPHHALPGWLATIFVLRHWRQPTLARTLPLLAAAVPLWSPLGNSDQPLIFRIKHP